MYYVSLGRQISRSIPKLHLKPATKFLPQQTNSTKHFVQTFPREFTIEPRWFPGWLARRNFPRRFQNRQKSSRRATVQGDTFDSALFVLMNVGVAARKKCIDNAIRLSVLPRLTLLCLPRLVKPGNLSKGIYMRTFVGRLDAPLLLFQKLLSSRCEKQSAYQICISRARRTVERGCSLKVYFAAHSGI